MKKIVPLESLGLLVLGIYLFSLLEYRWWWFLVLLLTPDFSMLGYLFGNKIGAFSYNVFHHQGIAILVYFTGIFINQEANSTCRNYFVFPFSNGSNVWVWIEI